MKELQEGGMSAGSNWSGTIGGIGFLTENIVNMLLRSVGLSVDVKTSTF